MSASGAVLVGISLALVMARPQSVKPVAAAL
jgi:hypothetical protein